MASTAISAQGTIVQIATGTGGAKTITAVAVGLPTILTSAAHGFSNGDVITFSAGFTGANASALNSKTYTVKNKTTNTFAVEEDTTGLTITAGTATATPTTYTAVANVKTMNGFDGAASEIDVTNLSSTAKEKRLGLVDNGAISLGIHQNNGDAGQAAVRARQVDGVATNFKVILPSGSLPTASFSGFVKKFSTSVGVDAVVDASVDITINGAVTWA